MIKSFYSIQELLELEIPGLPKTQRGLLKKAERENWTSQERNKLGARANMQSILCLKMLKTTYLPLAWEMTTILLNMRRTN